MTEGGLLGLMVEMRPALLRFLAARGAVREEAEDALQEIYLKLTSERAGPIAEPRAYLYRMAANQLLDLRKQAGRRTRREEAWVDAQAGAVPEEDQRPNAEAHLIARERLAIVQRMLDELPERTGAIFRRFRMEGEPQRAIAADLGISVSAVEKHLQRAYQAIVEAKKMVDADRGDRRRLEGERGRNGD